MERHRARLTRWAWYAPLAALLVLYGWPVLELLVRGIREGIDLADGPLTTRATRRAITFTITQAVLSTMATLFLALPLSALLANRRFRGRRAIRAFVTVPFVLPTIVVASAMLATAERTGLTDGPFALQGSLTAIVAAHVFFNVAVVVRTVGGFWSGLAADQERAARMLGDGAATAMWRVTLPRLRPALAAATVIVFLFSFTSFGVVLILGGTRFRTIETEIFRHAVSRTDFGTAAALSIIQLVTVAALVVVDARLRQRLNRPDDLAIDRAIPFASTRERIVGLVVVGGTLTFLCVPMLALLEGAFRTGDGWGLDHLESLTDRPPFLTVTPARAILNSLAFGLLAMVFATVIGAGAAMAIVFGPRRSRRLTDLASMLPLGTSAVTLGFGMLLAFDDDVIELRSSWLIIPLAQALIGAPFVVRAVVPVLRAIDPAMREAAATLGADAATIRRTVDAPIARSAVLSGAGFALAVGLGEFGATSFVGRDPDHMTVPLAIERLLSQPGDVLQGQAMALSCVLTVVTVAAVFAVDRDQRAGL